MILLFCYNFFSSPITRLLHNEIDFSSFVYARRQKKFPSTHKRTRSDLRSLCCRSIINEISSQEWKTGNSRDIYVIIFLLIPFQLIHNSFSTTFFNCSTSGLLCYAFQRVFDFFTEKKECFFCYDVWKSLQFPIIFGVIWKIVDPFVGFWKAFFFFSQLTIKMMMVLQE